MRMIIRNNSSPFSYSWRRINKFVNPFQNQEKKPNKKSNIKPSKNTCLKTARRKHQTISNTLKTSYQNSFKCQHMHKNLHKLSIPRWWRRYKSNPPSKSLINSPKISITLAIWSFWSRFKCKMVDVMMLLLLTYRYPIIVVNYS